MRLRRQVRRLIRRCMDRAGDTRFHIRLAAWLSHRPHLPLASSAICRDMSSCRKVKPMVTEALGQFHKTHEQETGLAQLQKHFSEDDWDSFRSLASPASYFC